MHVSDGRSNAALRGLASALRISPRRLARYINFAFAAVCLLLIGTLISWGAISYSQQQNQQRQQREQTTQYEASDGTQQWEATCTQIPSTRTASCVIYPPQSQAETHRTERDLRAQEQMANWALLMFFATMVGVAVTIIGLTYVIAAYYINARATEYAAKAADEATKANRQTRAQFIAQQRPWLRVGVVMTNAARFKDQITGEATCTITNYGPSPAINVAVIPREPFRHFGDEEREIFAHMTVVERRKLSDGKGDVVFPDTRQPLVLKRDIVFPEAGIWHLTGWVRYRFEGASEYHLTPFRSVITLRPVTLGERGRDQLRAFAEEDTVGIAPD